MGDPLPLTRGPVAGTVAAAIGGMGMTGMVTGGFVAGAEVPVVPPVVGPPICCWAAIHNGVATTATAEPRRIRPRVIRRCINFLSSTFALPI